MHISFWFGRGCRVDSLPTPELVEAEQKTSERECTLPQMGSCYMDILGSLASLARKAGQKKGWPR